MWSRSGPAGRDLPSIDWPPSEPRATRSGHPLQRLPSFIGRRQLLLGRLEAGPGLGDLTAVLAVEGGVGHRLMQGILTLLELLDPPGELLQLAALLAAQLARPLGGRPRRGGGRCGPGLLDDVG